MRRAIALFSLVLILSGCASAVGQNFDESKLEKLHKGRTTKQELIALFGQPDTETPYPEGHLILMWKYSQARAMDTTEGKTLTVQLANGVVTSYTVSKT